MFFSKEIGWETETVENIVHPLLGGVQLAAAALPGKAVGGTIVSGGFEFTQKQE